MIFGFNGFYILILSLHVASCLNKICHLKQNILLFYTRFQRMDVSPSSVTREEWSTLLMLFLNQELFSRSPNNSLKIWMSARKKGDEWRDFYDDQLIQYQAVPSGSAASGASENWWDKRCVAQGSEERWYLQNCYSDVNTCACTKVCTNFCC